MTDFEFLARVKSGRTYLHNVLTNNSGVNLSLATGSEAGSIRQKSETTLPLPTTVPYAKRGSWSVPFSI
jgi:hypothetical protein